VPFGQANGVYEFQRFLPSQLLERLWEAAEVVPAVGGPVITFVVVKSEPFLLGAQIMPRSLQIDKELTTKVMT
jgi:hypothetical protein